MCLSVCPQDNSRTRCWTSTKLGRHWQRVTLQKGLNLGVDLIPVLVQDHFSHTVIGQFSRKSKGAHAIHFGIISDLDFIWTHFRIRIKIWDQSVFFAARRHTWRGIYVIVGCPFICLSGSCIVSKWINILKHFIAPDIDIDRTIAILSVRPSVRPSRSVRLSGTLPYCIGTA